MIQHELSLVRYRSAAELAAKLCKGVCSLSLRLETSRAKLIIRTLAQWIPTPKRAKKARRDVKAGLSGEKAQAIPTRHRSSRVVTSMSLKPVGRSIALAAALMFASSAFAQDNQGTPEQRAACAPDAFRLCGRYIPDATSVESCLRLQTADLSDACRSVFEQSATQQAQTRDPRLHRR
jgi:hypothetical protein